ncbi:MAG TPA: universal stress protein [Acidimicrobiales bacterium]|nr:universal stress protein [Acidimicrobiales bacterium]
MTEDVPAAPAAGPGFELGTDGPRVIVVGIDGSDASLRAGAYAWGLARRQGSRLVAVWVRPHAATADLFVESAAAMAEARAQEAEAMRHEIEWAVAYYGIPAASLVVRHGDAFHELTALADEQRADAIVVGASERAGHRLVGSLGLRLVRAGRWPVTVVP